MLRTELTVAINIQPVIVLNPADTVGIIAPENGLAAGTRVSDTLRLCEHVPQGQKIALCVHAVGAPILRYGTIIGYATALIKAGDWIKPAMISLPAVPNLDNLPKATQPGDIGPAIEGLTFQGFRNTDGTVGTRNLLGVTTTVQCVSGIVEHAVRRIKTELLHKYPNVDGVVSLEHSYGCGVAIDAPEAEIPIRTLRNIAQNPNFGGELLVVSLGCEKLQPDRLFPPDAFPELAPFRLQDPNEIGFEALVRRIMSLAEDRLDRLNQRRRAPCPLSALTVGLQCGGSDAMSGVTANPAIGHASDLLVRAGATVMFSENTEVRDGIALLTARAARADIADELIAELAWYDDYLSRGQVDRAANTSPGNMAGGLANIVEKAMGSIAKSGNAPISGVLAPGERAKIPGLLFASTPASDFVCGTLQLAAGATVHVFTTGRGTPYSLEAMPTLKLSSNTCLAMRWPDLIDLDAGPIATGAATVADVGQAIFERIIATASGQVTWAEKHGTHNSLALFNPAPLT